MDKYAPEGIKTLHQYGFSTRTDPAAKWKDKDGKAKFRNKELTEEPGRADVMAVKNGFGLFIEFKTGGDSFPFSIWRENQRDWAQRYCIAPPFSNPYWLWIWVGEDPPHYNPEKYMPRRSWLMPHTAMLDAEDRIKPIQNSIPYKIRSGIRRELQDNHLDAITIFAPFEVFWMGKRIWRIPDTHLFHEKYIAGPSQPQPAQETEALWTPSSYTSQPSLMLETPEPTPNL